MEHFDNEPTDVFIFLENLLLLMLQFSDYHH